MTDEDSLFFKLVRVVNLAARPFAQRVGREHQLTLNEWRAMAVVGTLPGCTASQVAERCGLDKMTVSRALAGLLRAGRLERHGDPADQRCSRLYLSTPGKALYALVQKGARQREADLFEGMTAQERAQLGAMLDRLAASVLRTDA